MTAFALQGLDCLDDLLGLLRLLIGRALCGRRMVVCVVRALLVVFYIRLKLGHWFSLLVNLDLFGTGRSFLQFHACHFLGFLFGKDALFSEHSLHIFG